MKMRRCLLVAVLACAVWPSTAESQTCSSITQYGITWTFNTSYPCGQFVTGDWWVHNNGGSVTVTNITRPANMAERDGSMIDPPGSNNQGIDSRVGNYVASLNVANSLPLTISPTKSLVSYISDMSSSRPVTSDGAVLTIVASAPSAGTFRPPYAGTSKPMHNISSLQTGLLLSLAPVANTPTLSATASNFARVWLDHRAGWQGDYIHPKNNMPNYGAEMARQTHDAILRLLLNDTLSAKETLLYRIVQLGIDYYGNVVAGLKLGWVGGTIGTGRKAPIIFAGVLLNNTNMRNVATVTHGGANNRRVFQEDGQTFYLTQAERNGTYHSQNCSGDQSFCHPGYYDSDPLGTPSWGERHDEWLNTSYNYLPGKTQYRTSTYQNSVGSALFVRLMGLQGLWNWMPHLEWTDKLKAEGTGGSYGSSFQHSMWNAYRASAGGGDTTPPVVAITTNGGANFSTGTSPATIAGTCTDNEAVSHVTWSNAATGGGGQATGAGSWSASISLAAGGNTITAQCFDTSNNSHTASITVTLTGNASPTITITVPATSPIEVTASPYTALAGTASDSDGTVVSVACVNNQGGSWTVSGTTSWSVASGALTANVVNTVTCTATDDLGAIASASRQFYYVPTPATPFDSFNRANWPSLGPHWVQHTSLALGLVNNQASASGVAARHFSAWGAHAVGPDQFAQVTLGAPPSTAAGGSFVYILVRAREPGATTYDNYHCTAQTTGTVIGKILDGGSQQVLGATIPVEWNTGDVLRCSVSGSAPVTVSAYKNNEFIGSYQDSFSTITAGQPGIGAWGSMTFENFAGGEIGEEPEPPPPGKIRLRLRTP